MVPLNGQPPPPLPCRLVADEGGALLTWSNTITTKQDNEEESVCERERGLLLCSNTITTAMIERERGGRGGGGGGSTYSGPTPSPPSKTMLKLFVPVDIDRPANHLLVVRTTAACPARRATKDRTLNILAY